MDNNSTYIQEILHCPTIEDVATWLDEHPASCRVPLVVALKHVTDTHLNQKATLAHYSARCALLVAERVPADEQTSARMLAEWAMGNAMTTSGTAQQGLEHYTRAFDDARALDDRLAMARLRCNQGVRLYQLGRCDEARAMLEESRTLVPNDTPPAIRCGIEQLYGVILFECTGDSSAALATYARAAELAQAAEDYCRLLEISSNQAFIYLHRGELVAAETTFAQALSLSRQHQQPLKEAKIAMNLGELLLSQGRLKESLAMFRQAYQGFQHQDDSGDAALVQSLQSRLYRTMGLQAEAVAMAEESVATLSQLDWKSEQALAWMELLRAQRQSGRYSKATESANVARSIWESLGNTLRVAEVVGERAALALEQRNYAAALADARLALETFAASTEVRPLWAATARLTEAMALQHLGDWDTANEKYRQLINDSQATGNHWTLQAALLSLGMLAYARGQFATAQAYIVQAAEDLENTRRTLTVEELKARFLQHHQGVYDALVTLAATQGDTAATLSAMLRAKGGGLLDMLQYHRTRRTLSEAQQQEIETLRHRLSWARVQASTYDADTPGGEPLQHKIVQDEARLLDLLRHRQQEDSVAELAIPQTRHELAAMLPPSGGLLEYYLADTTLWGAVLHTDGTCQIQNLGDWDDEAYETLEEMTLLFDSVIKQATPRATPPALGPAHKRLHWLWQRLIAPWPSLPTNLLIAPHGPLGSVPFTALWNGQTYLCEKHTIALLPSGSLLVAPQQNSPTTGRPLVLGYSDGGTLPMATREAEQVGRLLHGADTYTDSRASFAVLRSLTQPPAVLHIAAHAALRDDAPLFSTIRLSDGEHSLDSWYELPLHGIRLAVLNACETGRVADQGGPMLAFQGALLGAGVRTLISSLWETQDHIAQELIHHFYQTLLAGSSPALALRYAQQTVRANPAHAHPALWAPFLCSGPTAFHPWGHGE